MELSNLQLDERAAMGWGNPRDFFTVLSVNDPSSSTERADQTVVENAGGQDHRVLTQGQCDGG